MYNNMDSKLGKYIFTLNLKKENESRS